MNPYGFKYGRRFNGNKVDLNRNCFDHRKKPFPGLAIHNPNYEKYREFLENEISALGVIKNGIFDKKSLTQALSGQYVSPKGFYYGGNEVQQECAITQKLVDAQIHKFKNVFHIDFHTGLGDFGVNQIMLNPSLTSKEGAAAYLKELETLKTLFPKDECQGVCRIDESDPNGFLTTGDFTQWIHDTYPKKRLQGRVLAVTAEIGTKSEIEVLPILVNENYCFAHPDQCNPERMSESTQELRNAFNPEDSKWQTQVYRSGEQLCRALTKFSHL